MYFERKVKDPSPMYWAIYPVSVFVLGALALLVFGPIVAAVSMAVLILLYGFYALLTFFRTRNYAFLVQVFFLVMEALLIGCIPLLIAGKIEKQVMVIFVVGMYVSMIWLANLAFVSKKLKWRGRDVFELAAMPIEDTGSGYTPRPRPVGQTQVSRTEMLRYTDFITRNLVAFAYVEDNRVVFVPALSGKEDAYLLGLKKGYQDSSWVAIGYDGNVSVNLTEKDYLEFRQDFDFDQLCQSLGGVFIEFLELSKKGQEQRILDRMNALKLFPLS